MKRQISFFDDDKKLFKIDVEIKTEDNKKKFSASGESGNSCGQCLDDIKPANKHQKKLVEIWKEYHLNDTNAGTPKQTRVIDAWKETYSYDKACEYLNSLDSDGKPLSKIDFDKIDETRRVLEEQYKEVKNKIEIYEKTFTENRKGESYKKLMSGGVWIKIDELKHKEFYRSLGAFKGFIDRNVKKLTEELNLIKKDLNLCNLKTLLYDLHPETGEVYKYGNEWIYNKLPENFEEELNKVCDEIENKENERKENLDEIDWKDIEDYKAIALGKSLQISAQETQDTIVKERDNNYSYGGVEYFVGDKNEVHDEAIIYLTDDTYLFESWVEEQVKNGNASKVMNIDDWAEWVIKTDGYGHLLNSWDGTEDNQQINGTTYYVIRR